jgi:aryl-alcohol dehydrogenase-like predicted oxidoreductase
MFVLWHDSPNRENDDSESRTTLKTDASSASRPGDHLPFVQPVIRRSTMQQIALPGTELTVSQLCFGCWGITSDFHWGERDRQLSLAAIHAALDAGVNFFDTAAAYADGASERLLGEALGGRRDPLIIATKVHPKQMTPSGILQECEDSLRRLGTDYIDLYQTHWASTDATMQDCWSSMLKLKEQGKVRHVGVCNLGPLDLADVCEMEPPVTNQLPYSLLWRVLEHEILPGCQERKIGVLAYSPLLHGLLADKFQTADEVPDGRARTRHFRGNRPLARHGEPGCEQQTFDALDAIRQIAVEINRPMADLALAWCAQQPGVSSVIVGVSTAEQLQRNVAGLVEPLPPEIVSRLNAATDDVKRLLGTNADMWDGSENSRFR